MFACTRKERLLARSGAPYLALELRDRSGTLPRASSATPTWAGRFERGELVRVSGRVVRFRDEPVLELIDIARIDARRRRRDARPGEFLPVAYRDLDELDGFLEHLAREVATAGLPALLERAAGRSSLRARTGAAAPCTRAGHHAYLGGLLEHTVAVATLAQELALGHPRLNHDLLLCAAIVHDIGKTREFTYGASIELCEEGRLLGHVPIGLRLMPSAPACSTTRACSRSSTACSATTAADARPGGRFARSRRSRCTASTRSTRASRARSSTDSGSRR